MLSLLLSTSCIGQSSSNTSSKAEELDKLLRTYASYGKFNGAVLVAEEGKVIYKKAFGMANMEWDMPNQVDTKFRIASMTKQFTAMLIMQLVAENKLNLEEPISSYLPDYPKEVGQKVNIHHLLSHTSGIPNYTSFPGYQKMMGTYHEPNDLVELFADSTLLFEPGVKFSYSNSGYVVLGVILEKVTGQSFEKVLQENILTPLKMENTGYDNNRKLLHNRALGYYSNAGVYTNSNPINMTVGYTAGGLHSTVEDMYLWDQALYTEKLLPQKYLDVMFTKHIPAWGGDYGYGWNIGDMRIGNTDERMSTINHDGVINGFNSIIVRIPASQSSVILLNNTGNARLYKMSEAIAGILYDRPYDMPKQSVANSLYAVINQEGIVKGVDHYHKIKDNDTYNLSELEMNMVSYELLKSDRGEAAAEVLRLAIESFPNSFNLYDSFGEVLRTLGKEKEAISNYTKSVQLNPSNKNGLKMLSELGVEIDEADLWMLQSDKSWSKEIFILPLHFAPDLKYTGKEEAHFPPGWRNPDSPEFWSYIIAWKVDASEESSEAQIERDLQIYFEGLLNLVNKDKSRELPRMIANINRSAKNSESSSYTGAIEIFDTFVTNDKMTLQISVESSFCEKEKKALLIFRMSPKGFDHSIWKSLQDIALTHPSCGQK